MIDTHTHLYLPEFDADGRREAVGRAVTAGVDHMIFPNVDLSTIAPMRSLAAECPGVVSMAMGLHPTEIRDTWRDDLAVVERELRENLADYVAVGEVGIDLYWDATFRREQLEAFDEQCRWAEELRRPVIIHCRNGLDETLEVLKGHRGMPAVFHSFGGSEADVERIMALGDYYFGINGIITFKNSNLRDVVKTIPRDRLLLETDSPYLAPVPHRGRRNESAYVIDTAKALAAALGLGYDEIDSITTANAAALFGLNRTAGSVSVR